MSDLTGLRQELYALMNEATDEIARRTPEACEAMLGTEAWKAYKAEEQQAGDTNDAGDLHQHLLRMRQLLDQINAL